MAPGGSALVTGSRVEFDAWRTRLTNSPPADGTQEPTPASSHGDGPAGTRPAHAQPCLSRRWTAVLALLFVAGVAVGASLAVALMPAPQYPTRFIVEGTQVMALTDTDDQAWAHQLSAFARRPATMNYTTPEQGDLDGDGSAEVAVAVSYVRPRMASPVSDAVMLFGGCVLPVSDV